MSEKHAKRDESKDETKEQQTQAKGGEKAGDKTTDNPYGKAHGPGRTSEPNPDLMTDAEYERLSRLSRTDFDKLSDEQKRVYHDTAATRGRDPHAGRPGDTPTEGVPERRPDGSPQNPAPDLSRQQNPPTAGSQPQSQPPRSTQPPQSHR